MNLRWTVLGLLLSCSGLACSTTDGVDAKEEVVDTLKEPLWRRTTEFFWPGGSIPVCFTGMTSAQRTRIRSLVEDGWERAAKLAFSGWGTCPTITPTTTNLLVVAVNPDLEDDDLAGRSRHCMGTGLNAFTCSRGAGWAGLNKFNRVEFQTADGSNFTILHEFGHALGFRHQTEDDSCAPRTGDGISYSNEPDPMSIMVAFRTCNGETPILSAWDVLGVRRTYGRKPTNSLVGSGGLCAAVEGDNSAGGTRVVALPCSGARNTTFRRPFDLTLRSNPGGVERCMTIQGSTATPNGTPVLSSACTTPALPSSEFHFRPVEWRAMGTKCVQAESTATAAKLSIQDCDNSILQKWIFFANNRRIQLSGTNLCVNVPASQTALGTEVILWPCAAIPASNELYLFTDGYIKPSFISGDRCLHVLGAITAPGMRIGLWDGCSASPPLPSAQFTIRGPVVGAGNQCLTKFGGFDGTGTHLFTCNGGSAQQWEYFF